MSSRLSTFKNRGKDEEFRRKFKEDGLELRKAKKDDQLNKRRNLEEDDGEIGGNSLSPERPKAVPSMSLHEILQGLQSEDKDAVIEATRSARKVLSKERNPPIDQFINAGIVPKFVELLKVDEPTIQFEAGWALTNIASGNQEQTRTVVEAGACALFVELLRSPARNVVEQSVWALANIAGDGPHYRDMVIQLGIVKPLVALVDSSCSPSFLGNIAWCISNLCRNKNPPPPFSQIKVCLPTIVTLLQQESRNVISDCCWSLSYLTDGPNERIEAVCQLGVIPRLVEVISSSSDKSLVLPALRTLGNIVTGTEEQTQLVVDSGFLQALRFFLIQNGVNIRKECAWAVSNITAGNQKQIQAVIDEGLLEPIIEVLSTGDFKTKKEATWALTNLSCGGNTEQVAYMVRAGSLPPLTDMMDCDEPKIIIVVLDAFRNILNTGSKMGELETICVALEEIGFLDKLEMLQRHENEEVYQAAVHLMDTYWNTDEEDPNLAPENEDDEAFIFKPNEQMPSEDFNF